MVKRKTAESWGFKCLGMDIDQDNEIIRIFCKTCREFYGEADGKSTTLTSYRPSGMCKDHAMIYVTGTTVIKKINFQNHISKNEAHKIAELRLKEKSVLNTITPLDVPSISSTTEEPDIAIGGPRQTLLRPLVQKMNTVQRNQLVKKFQLAHYIASSGKSFKSYANIAKFEKVHHGVDLGNAYMTQIAGAEIAKYIAISKQEQNITRPLNNNILHYYSILMDGSSSAKCVDEKELYIIKTCVNGSPHFNVMSLEEPPNGDAPGLKQALDTCISKMKFNFERRTKEIGMCSDAAAVNRALFDLVKSDMDDAYLHILCPSHKFELAINDAFNSSTVNDRCEKDYTDIYYLFKKSPLRWRLLKRQSVFMGIPIYRYKRLTGTRWIEHRVNAIESYIKNLPILIGFCEQQIIHPHNNTIKKLVDTLKGVKKNITTYSTIFNVVKLDILSLIRPISKIMQDVNLLTPQFITTTEMTIENIRRVNTLIQKEHCDTHIFNSAEFFPNTKALLENLKEEETDIIPERQTRGDTDINPQNEHTLFHGYLLNGSITSAINKTIDQFKHILDKLETALSVRFDSFIGDPLFTATAVFLDTVSYKNKDADELLKALDIITNRFHHLLTANNCQIDRLKSEFRLLFNHVVRFLPNTTNSRCWPQLFEIKDSLGLSNILHIAELCIAIPISNAECERIFSFLWRTMTKERTSLTNESLERLLQLRGITDYDVHSYDHAIDLFLSVYPDGTVRKRKRRVGGHAYPAKRKSVNSASNNLMSIRDIHEKLKVACQPTDIDISDISDDDDSSSSSDDYSE